MADQISGENPTENPAEKPTEKPTGVNRYALQCAIVASIVSIIFGYDTGVMSGAMVFIEEDLKTNDVQIEVLTGILNLCALVGSLLAGRTSDVIGRRYTIVLASILFMLGSILMGWGPSYPVLLTGRCTAGLGVGFALMVAPVYSAEIATASHRGLLASLPHLCISIGILLGYLVNYFFSKLPMHIGWRLMLGIAAIPSLVLAFGILKMPESPRWLILQGRLGEGKRILHLVSNSPEEAELRFQDIKTAAGIDPKCEDEVMKIENKKTHGEGVWKELIFRPTPAVRRVLLTALGIHFFQHATGIEAVLLYGPKIFKRAGITTKDKLFLVTIGVGIMKTTFIFTATFLLDKVGRRKLLLTSVGGMVCALTMLGFGLTMAQNSGGKLAWALILSIVSAYSFVAVFSIGLGPITWVYSSEVFPLKLRAQGASLGVAVNRVMNATVSMSFLSLTKAITTGGAFFMFAGVAAVAWNFFFFLMPETKGKSLEEIERRDDRGDRRRRRSRSRSKDRSERRSRSRSPSKSKRVSGFDMAPPASAILAAGAAVTGQVPPAPPTLPGAGMFPNILSLPTGQAFGGLPMMPIQAMTQQATRHARRVYVGGLSPAANEQSVATFFSQVMAAVGGNTAGPGDAVVNVYINHEKKFAFVEMRSVEEASNAMSLDGIIFEGAPVKVRRPSDYNPSLAAALGPSQPSPHLNLAAVGLTPGASGGLEGPDRIFVGGLPYYFTELQVRELLESFGALKGFDLVKDRETGNSKGYAFCVYQDLSVTDIACAALNGIKMGDKTLTVRRANQGTMQPKPEQESVLLHAQQQIAFQRNMLQPGAAATTVVCLTQVITEDELRDDEEYEDIMEDMRQEGGKFGALTNVVIPRPSPSGEPVPGLGKVFLKYADTDGSLRARTGMNGRKFGGNEVVAVFYPEEKFDQGEYGA